MSRVLLIEDHARLAGLIRKGLEAAGIGVDVAACPTAWGLSEAVTPNALDVALHRLRRKLLAIGSRQRIVNVRGLGYALRHDEPVLSSPAGAD